MTEGDAVRVCVRVRPLLQREPAEQVNLLWKAEKSTISQIDGPKSFNFDRVFHSSETTGQVYQEMAVPIIRSVLHGYHGTIFAYGQTSSGKTYTMMGTAEAVGIIPQAVQDIFKIIQEIPNREFLLRVSYMEIYNETVTDLLCDDRKKKPLEIREDLERNVYVADLTEEIVMIPDHVMKWIKKGEKNRHYGETKMNEHSSRSHTIFRMIIESRERSDHGNSENCDGAVMVSHLSLVDLAGSERASQTGAEGVRLKEGCNINRSLFILGQVIKKLSDGQAGGFINYRDSKLTRILQNSLGGNTKTLIICTVRPVSFDETLSTLQFASTAKHVRNTPHVNEVVDDQALLKRYRKEIMDLKKQLEQLEASSEVRTHATAKEETAQLLAEIQQLQKERQNRIWNLTNIIIASSQESEQDQKVKRKRRVTWAPGKLQNSLGSCGFSDSDVLSKPFHKKPKFSDLTLLTEVDDSICTEFSDFDEMGPEPDVTLMSKVTSREKTAAYCQSVVDMESEDPFLGSSQLKDLSQQNSKEMEQKISDLESQLKKMTENCESENKAKESFANEIASLKEQLQLKGEETDNLVKALELQVTNLEGQLHTVETSDPVKKCSLDLDGLSAEKSEIQGNTMAVLEEISCTLGNHHVEQEIKGDNQSSREDHSMCDEQIKMLEQKILDLEQIIETLGLQSKQDKEGTSRTQDLMESVLLCEALMTEKGNALEEMNAMRNNFDSVILENECFKRKVTELERQLSEKTETNEFEVLEMEMQKEHEAQLAHEIVSLKKVVENAEVYNQDLESELGTKSNLLKDQENQILELKKTVNILQNRVRNVDLSSSLGDSDKLCEEVFRLKQSLADAEVVTRDAQKESAFLRSENRELKEKMDHMSIHCQQREKDASFYEKQLEAEKAKFKQMQADLQKELQCAFNEINHLSGLMAGKVPKDLLSRVELEKEMGHYSKQLATITEEKCVLEKEMASLSEYKSLPNEIEHLKTQINQASEELSLLKEGQEQSSSVISKQDLTIKEQSDQISRLTDEGAQLQTKLHETEEQFAGLKKLHDELEEQYLSSSEQLIQKQNEAECSVKEINQLQHSINSMETKLSCTLKELDQAVKDKESLLHEQEVLKAQQAVPTVMEEKSSQFTIPLENLDDVKSLLKEKDDMLTSIKEERDHLQEQVNNLCSLVEVLKEQTNEFHNEQQCNMKSEIEQLQICLKEAQLSLDISTAEKCEVCKKLECIEKELILVEQQRCELLSSLEKLQEERDDLRHDLNENIELSIESQDELRSTQQELKEHKMLVVELKRQLEDTATSNPLNLDPQGPQIQHLAGELNLSACSQLSNGDVDLQKLQQKVLALDQEKSELHEILENVRAEKDQLKLDLQENIETSIETQEELRGALEELKNRAILLDDLKSQLSVQENLTKNLESDQKHKIFQLEEDLNVLTNDRDKLVAELSNAVDKKLELDGIICALTAEINDLQEKSMDSIQINTVSEELSLLKEGQEQSSSVISKQDLTIKEQSDQISRLTDEGAQLQTKLHETEEQFAGLKKLHDELEEQYLSSSEQLIQKQNEAECSVKEINQLQHSINSMETKLSCTLQELDQAVKDKESLLHEQEVLKAQQAVPTVMEEKSSQFTIPLENLDEVKSLLKEKDDMLTSIKEERDHLQEQVNNVMSLKVQLEQTKSEHQLDELVQDQARLQSEVENLLKKLDDTESTLQSLQREKNETEQALRSIKSQMEAVTLERDELKTTETSLIEKVTQERAELIFTQENLISERDQLKEDLKENVEMSIETQDDLRKAQEELQQQNHKVHQMTSQIALLEEKLAFVEKQVDERETLLSETLGDRDLLANTKQELDLKVEQLSRAFMHSESALEQVKQEKDEALKRVPSLTVVMGTMSEERCQLQEEVKKLSEELELLKHERDLLEALHSNESKQLKELVCQIEQLMGKLQQLNSRALQLEDENDTLQKQIQQQDLKISSLNLEKDQFQQLLQRVRSEKESIYSELQSQEKLSNQLTEELNKCHAELQAVKQKDAIEHLDFKVKLDGLSQQISSLQQEIQQLQQTITEERNLNFELRDEIELKDKDLLLLNLKLSLPPEEEETDVDQLAERMDNIKSKTQEITDLLVKMSGVYSDQHSLINHLSSEIQTEVETSKTDMCRIKDFLSPTFSISFRILQTEHIQLNSQLQTVISKIKMICIKAAVKEEQYRLIKDREEELISEQKKHDELELQIQCLEQHGIKWTDSAAADLKFYELEFLSKIICKKYNLIKHVEEDYSEIQDVLSAIESVLRDEVKSKQSFYSWLKEFDSLSFDATQLNDGIQKENGRILGIIQLMTKKLKVIIQLKTPRAVSDYLKHMETELEKLKEQYNMLSKKIQHVAHSVNASTLEENAILQENLRSLQAELKKMQSRIKTLEEELNASRAETKQEEERVTSLQSKHLAKIRAQLAEKETSFHNLLTEIQKLKSTVARGAEPYQEEIDKLKTQVVKGEMEKMKMSKSMDKEIESLKSCVEEKEECLRKLKEQLRRTQIDCDTSVCSDQGNPGSSNFPLTCGGGSGIVQSTAILVLQSQKSKLESELSYYKKMYSQRSRNLPSRENKKIKVSETPASNANAQLNSMPSSQTAAQTLDQVSPSKMEVPNVCLASPGKTGMKKMLVAALYMTEARKRVPPSPSKTGRHSVASPSSSKTTILSKCGISPDRTSVPLLSPLTSSPSKNQNLLKTLASPKSKFFDARSKSLPYCPPQFFDNSKLVSLSDLKNNDTPEKDTSEWWDENKVKTNECKPS